MVKEVILGVKEEMLDILRDKYKPVEIVRCKDCKYWWKGNRLCSHPMNMDGSICCLECKADFFCARGERRVDGE